MIQAIGLISSIQALLVAFVCVFSLVCVSDESGGAVHAVVTRASRLEHAVVRVRVAPSTCVPFAS